MDSNKPLFNNTYIPNQEEIKRNIINTEEFQEYYKKNLQLQQEEKILKDIDLKSKESYIQSLNNSVVKKKDQVKILERKTTISIDTRDARKDKTLYPKSNHFKVFLGKTFYNVKSIELVKIEFPNTSAVINSSNRNIYWRNQEDIQFNVIDDITLKHPVYSIQLRIGNYNLSSLQREIQLKLSSVKRRFSDIFHSFYVNLDYDTDIVTFTSLTLQYLNNNPMTSLINSGIVRVSAINHGFVTGDTVTVFGANAFSGLTVSILNSSFLVTVIDNDNFTIEVTINATESIDGGGNVVRIGKNAPFQLMYGDNDDTIAPILGFPVENSSQRINTKINTIKNLKPIEITTVHPHGFSNNQNFLGKLITILNATTSPIIQLCEIMYIIDASKIGVVAYNFNLSTESSEIILDEYGADFITFPSSFSNFDDFYRGWYIRNENGEVRKITSYVGATKTATFIPFIDQSYFGNVKLYETPFETDLTLESEFLGASFLFNEVLFPVKSIKNYTFNLLKIKTNVQHNYDSTIDEQITLYNTRTVPDFDGLKTILSVPDFNTIIFRGSVLFGEAGTGEISRYNPLKSTIHKIINSFPGQTTIFETETSHELKIGDKIKIYNVLEPSDKFNSGKTFEIISLPSATRFEIDVISTSISIDETSYFGYGLLYLSFPDHGFNQITSLINGDPGEVIITTKIPHNFIDNQFVTIAETNTIPSLDGAYNISVLTENSFSINFYKDNAVITGTLPEQTGALVNQFYFTTTIDYTGYFIKITSGDAEGEFKFIKEFTSNVATLESNWIIPPVIDDTFILYQLDTQFNFTLGDQSNATTTQIVFPANEQQESLISPGDYIRISSSSPVQAGIVKKIVSFDSLTKIITLDTPWEGGNPQIGTSCVLYNAQITTDGDFGITNKDNNFNIYGSSDIGGINNSNINNQSHVVRDIIDKNTITFMVNGYSNKQELGGGTNIFISSLIHGFSGNQDNTKNDILNRSINLQGENYVFICSPQLNTMLNTGTVEDVFARITLDTSPGTVVFSSVSNTLSQPKEYFSSPQSKLEELEFYVRNHDNSLYDFNDLDWSMALTITEYIQSDESFNKSSRTGINN